ncbi:MAG: carbohydrate porin [Phycisphaerales bacterium]
MIRNATLAGMLAAAAHQRCALAADGAAAPPDQASPTTAEPAPTGPAAPHRPPGLVPLVDYTGDLWTRQRLTGDWGGARTTLADVGIQFDVEFTQVMQSVVDGGRDSGTRYGGGLDYNLLLDLHRMGILDGAIVQFRAESRYGESANDIAGPLLPVNTDAFFPLTTPLDNDIGIALTTLKYTQFFSEHFAIFLGKFDTIEGDPNEFASGRGQSQFMNGNFVFPTAPIMMAPYSTLGAGILVAPIKGVTISSLVYSVKDSSTTSGFENIGDGTSWLTEADFQYRLGDLPGGQNIGFGYAFDATFAQLNQRFTFQPGQGLSPPTTSSTWAVYWSGWQYVWVKDPSDAPINVLDGIQDRQGLGLFARFGVADQDVNPIEWTATGGVGGKGLIPGRDNDTFGVGLYYLSLQTLRLYSHVGVSDHSQGLEAYYNVSITPATDLTFDVQVADAPFPGIDTAVILGLRLGLKF